MSTKEGMLLASWAEQRPDAPAIISPSGDRTFAALNGAANQLTRALRRRGLVAGDAVALLCGNQPAFAEVVYACQRAGFRLTPINWHMTAAEVAYVVADCEAKVVIASADLTSLAPGGVARMVIGGDYEDALEVESSEDIDDSSLGSTMLYTSGTTGRPKGVYRRVPAASATINLFGYDAATDLHLCTGPLYHAAPLAFSLAVPLALGVGVVVMDTWEAEPTLQLIEKHRVTHTHMVPTMFHRLLSLPDDVRTGYDVSSLRNVLHGAAPCPVAVKRRLIEWLGPVVWEYYAATEGVGSFVDSATWLAHPGTVGRPLGEGQVIIGDDTGSPLPTGETGLVYLKAPATGRFEYFNDSDKTDSTYRGDYFTLGDVGYIDADGFLYLTDRSANLIISGGVNIYPAETDAVLLEHPAVADVATIGVPDAEWGEQVKAVVELQSGVQPSEQLAAEMIEFCRERLAHFKCPRSIDFIDHLPRQDNGKIYKRLLRDRYRVAGGAGQQ
jgi:long-chain acyl-CoA synthetase